MHKLLIIVNAKVKEAGKIAASPVTEKMVNALIAGVNQELIRPTYSKVPGEIIAVEKQKPVKIEVVAAASLWSEPDKLKYTESGAICCPLTIQLPYDFDFPARDVWRACQDIKGRRNWVAQKLNYKTSTNDTPLGDLWLPAIVTEEGLFYEEIIGEGAMPNSYQQPVNLPDRINQSVYNLADKLLESIDRTPGVYLLQFCLRKSEIIFDRLWPFPAAPALASIRMRQPNLYTYHWHCLSGKKFLNSNVQEKVAKSDRDSVARY
ncbi:MAG: hypothetical protein ACFBSE_04150 [Prochloraceae cyanobacterium]